MHYEVRTIRTMRWVGDVTVENLLGSYNAHAHSHYAVKPMRKPDNYKHSFPLHIYKTAFTRFKCAINNPHTNRSSPCAPLPMRIMRQAVVPVEHLPELSGNKNLEDLESQARHSVPPGQNVIYVLSWICRACTAVGRCLLPRYAMPRN